MINILRETKNVTTFKIEVEDGHGEVFKALTLGHISEHEDDLLPKLRVVHVRTCPRLDCEPLAITPLAEMAVSRSPRGAGALDVDPLQVVWLDITNSLSVQADVNAVLAQLGHRADMPRIKYEKSRWYLTEMWWSVRQCC